MCWKVTHQAHLSQLPSELLRLVANNRFVVLFSSFSAPNTTVSDILTSYSDAELTELAHKIRAWQRGEHSGDQHTKWGKPSFRFCIGKEHMSTFVSLCVLFHTPSIRECVCLCVRERIYVCICVTPCKQSSCLSSSHGEAGICINKSNTLCLLTLY